MKLVINAATQRGYGSGFVARNIITHLRLHKKSPVISSFVPQEWNDEAGQMGNVTSVKAGSINKIFFENTQLRSSVNEKNIDALFSLGDTSLPFCKPPHLLMVQQAYLAYDSEDYGFKAPFSLTARFKMLEAYFRLGMSSVNMYTVQTNDMKCRLSARWDIPPEKIIVVPSACGSVGGRVYTPDNGSPYVCFVASPGHHKNFKVLIDMMRVLKVGEFSDLTLKLTINESDLPELYKYARREGVLNSIQFLGPLSMDASLDLMFKAQAVVHPSNLESFGVVLYEAMAMGCPIVASDNGFSREACGDAALYASPDSGEEFADRIATLLESTELQGILSKKSKLMGVKKAVSWNSIASMYIDALERTVEIANA
jgi:glycosyltransferase involved in cell wall biosynthesis